MTKIDVMPSSDDKKGLLEVSILRRHDEAENIISLELVAVDGKPLPQFDAGAHVDVHIAPGLIRQYSLCSDPADTRTYRLGILLDAKSRGGSAGIHAAFHNDKAVFIGRPRNNFALPVRPTRVILLAGGIGVTPLLAMAYRLVGLSIPFELHYCTRSRKHTAFLQDIAAGPFAENVHLHHGNSQSGQRLDFDRDLPSPVLGTHIYICGPRGFMTWSIEGARSRGWSDDQIHTEYFVNETKSDGGSFTVEARRSGKSVQVPSGTNIVDALASVGVFIPVSCEQGVCGTCLTDVIDGIPDHRDMYQTENERVINNKITPCCSRALTPILVLDI